MLAIHFWPKKPNKVNNDIKFPQYIMNEEKQEITNAVLAEKISGLTKLTDERFSVIKDALVRIEEANKSYATKNELAETRKDFNKNIEEIKRTQEGQGKEQQKMNNILLKWVGGLAVITFALPILVPIILHFWFHI